ncbi:N-acetyltransferase family protein [Microbacterium aurugineum]
MTDPRPLASVVLRTALAEDAEWIAELRADVLRADLERLGRYDPTRVRQRFRDAFEPAYTRIIVVDAVDVGSVALRPDGDITWLEHLYLDASHQGRGVGTRVLAMILDDDGRYRLNVLQGSPARSLYERHGFTVDSQDDVDVFMTREPGVPAVVPTRGPLS